MSKTFLTLGAIFAGLGIVLGAFGAHLLKSKLSPESLQSFETGVRYQVHHAIALIIVYLLNLKLNSSHLNYSGIFFTTGIILFSGSIYLLSCRDILGIDGWKKILGPLTPLGGLSFILGWICMVIASVKSN